MKLFVISARDSIVAITEKRKIAERFTKERSNINPIIHKLENKKMINTILLELDNYHLEEDSILEILVTGRESAIFMSDIHDEYNRIQSTLRDMEWMTTRYNSPFKITNNLTKGIKGLRELSDPATFGVVFGLDILIKGLNTHYMPLNKYLDRGN